MPGNGVLRGAAGHVALDDCGDEGDERKWNRNEKPSDRQSRAVCPSARNDRGYDQVAAARGSSRPGQLCQDKQLPHLVNAGCGSLEETFGGENWGVWTVSTLWVTDWAVPVPDWPGFRMFRRESSVCKGWNPVRVPPRAQCFPCSGASGPLSVHKLFTDGPLGGLFCWRPWPPLVLCSGDAGYLFMAAWAANCMT